MDIKSVCDRLRGMETKILEAEKESCHRLAELIKVVGEMRQELESSEPPKEQKKAPTSKPPATEPAKVWSSLSWPQVVLALEVAWLKQFIPDTGFLTEDDEPCSAVDAVHNDDTFRPPWARINVNAVRARTPSRRERGDWARQAGKDWRGPNNNSCAGVGTESAMLVGRLLQEAHCLDAPQHALAIQLLDKVRKGKAAPGTAYSLLARSRAAFFRAKNGRSLNRSYASNRTRVAAKTAK